MSREPLTIDDLLDHSRNCRWRGRVAAPDWQGRVRNPLCGDEIALTLTINSGSIKDIRFEGRGCFLSQAAASVLCEHIVGKRVADLEHCSPAELLGFDPATFSTNRQHCALLAVDALRRILATHSDQSPP